jgi:hypothetical protein
MLQEFGQKTLDGRPRENEVMTRQDSDADDRQDEDGNHVLPANEVKIIKDQLLNLMISSPAGIQSQLGDAISVIAESDFWERWDTLVDVGTSG